MRAVPAQRSALMLAAHPPGGGTGSAVRGAVVLEALREACDRVDVVALAHEGEERFADPAAHLVARVPPPAPLGRLALLPRGGPYFADERAGRLAARLRELTAAGVLLERYDVVWSYSVLVARAGLLAGARARVLDIDNVPSADVRLVARQDGRGPAGRAYHELAWRALGRQERARAAEHDAVTVTSEDERDRLGDVAAPVLVLPNAVPEAPAAPVRDSPQQALFVGSLHYAPNVDAVTWIARDIAPALRALVPGARIRVVGRRPSPGVREACAAAGIELVADAPSLTEHYAGSRLLLAPLRIGGGTGRIKVLEGLAHGMPIVATPQAVEGLALEPGTDVLVARDAAGLAREAARLLEDPAAAGRLGDAARARWRRDHDPAATRRAVHDLLGRLLREKS